MLSLPSNPLWILYTLLIVPERISNAAEPLYGEIGAGSSWVPHGLERVTEPYDGAEGSVTGSPNEVNERLNFAAIGLSSSVSISITSEIELKRLDQRWSDAETNGGGYLSMETR